MKKSGDKLIEYFIYAGYLFIIGFGFLRIVHGMINNYPVQYLFLEIIMGILAPVVFLADKNKNSWNNNTNCSSSCSSSSCGGGGCGGCGGGD